MKLIFTNGCFDLFHFGHLYLLKEAKKLGDILYVGINSDESIKKLKGSDRPIIPQEQRYEIVSSIKYVDEVFIFNELTPKNLIEMLQPDIVVKGGDWKVEDVVGSHISDIVTIPLIPDISTSKIIKKLK